MNLGRGDNAEMSALYRHDLFSIFVVNRKLVKSMFHDPIGAEDVMRSVEWISTGSGG